MHRRDKRRAIRVACSLPVRIRSRTGWLDVEVIDLSRGGVRIALADAAVGISRRASLLDVARRLGAILPERIDAALGEGEGIVRQLRVVRIGKRDPSSETIELGCLFDRSLDDGDALALGAVLPREGESWDQAERRLEGLKAEKAPASEQGPSSGSGDWT